MKARDLHITACSRIWESAPVPASDQPWYNNAIVRLDTDLPAHLLMDELKAIEEQFGRVRMTRNEARVLDLDLIAANDEVFETDKLVLPHPRMHERAFVLMPLREIAPEWVHPVLKKPINDLIAALPPQEIRAGEPLL
jgi:2-amino-4-hydroxy-6-hydroxymethyldihydropteridine diphosphokinase